MGTGGDGVGGVLLYSHGSPARAGKPVTQTGIALHAASGYSSVRAHDNRAVLNAKQDVELSSTQAEVLIDSPNKHVLLACQGAYIKLEGDNIELGAPGLIEFKASMKQWLGPQGRSSTAALPKGDYKGCDAKE
ncbi:hypothetical protein CO611_09020 [Lysobacteraceae bacterium NML03-0222]|nr:hypothetical protein CO611_09020 [Xanthomonadaceae bacterium NML03-0222]